MEKHISDDVLKVKWLKKKKKINKLMRFLLILVTFSKEQSDNELVNGKIPDKSIHGNQLKRTFKNTLIQHLIPDLRTAWGWIFIYYVYKIFILKLKVWHHRSAVRCWVGHQTMLGAKQMYCDTCTEIRIILFIQQFVVIS